MVDMNIVFVSHCDLRQNSGLQIANIANVLSELGVASVVCVPGRPDGPISHIETLFKVITYLDALDGVEFSDGRGPDLIHAWTPRELVRVMTERLCAKHGCPYLVHLEDNEHVVVRDNFQLKRYEELAKLPQSLLDALIPQDRIHPNRYREFMEKASGVTALIDRLLEFKPAHVPSVVFWPGFSRPFANLPVVPHSRRMRIGLRREEKVLVYTGNVHPSNEAEVRSLCLAVLALRDQGLPVRLLKAGSNYRNYHWIERAVHSQALIELGFLPQNEIPKLLSLADVLVQPGASNEFNDYRFPSKLPEYLVSGKPVALPLSNIGRFLRDREEALILRRGDSVEIAEAVELLLADESLRERIGRGGREFALRALSWPNNVPPLKEFYKSILQSSLKSERFLVDTAENGVRLHEFAPLVKLIAFYDPKFYSSNEKDESCGSALAAWARVGASKPAFPGHHQPQLPTDPGSYDTRPAEVIEHQAELARQYGIYGFCFHYYWFNGRKLFEQPVEQMLLHGKPDMPFCLCWANHSWTDPSDVTEQTISIDQVRSSERDSSFIRDVIPFLKDPRYIQVNGAPFLLVSRADLLPNPLKTVSTWREACAAEGIPRIHLCAVRNPGVSEPRAYGFDAAVEYPPLTERKPINPTALARVAPKFLGYFEDFGAVSESHMNLRPPEYLQYAGIMPRWDDTPRRADRAHIVLNSSPDAYRTWLHCVVERALLRSDVQEPYIFINSWNAWMDGAYLEPDNRYGHAYLEATRIGLAAGIADYYKRTCRAVDENVAVRSLKTWEAHRSGGPFQTIEKMSKTQNWFDDKDLATVACHYRGTFSVPSISYGTVRDFCDSFDHLRPLAVANGDLKDCQRPWAFKSILGKLPKGGRILEIGAGEPFVADLLNRLGYETWVVDPYDGSGNGPLEYERFRKEYPSLKFVRDQFNDRLQGLPEGGFDCIYSISVLEHIPPDGLTAVFAGMKKFLKPDGLSIHAVDHVHKGNGAMEHLANLNLMVKQSGYGSSELERILHQLSDDTDTYYLSAEGHNRWRGHVPYENFPMRVCVSIQLCSSAPMLR
jgi:glycosyltransferase involved in cell wall biosynthesis/SAM-dependent methyltransferase